MNAKLGKRLQRKMALGRDAGRQITRIDDAELQLEWACEKERNAALAHRIGLPAIGSKLSNKHGIEWEVLGHTYVPTVNNLLRLREEGEEQEDLYPVVKPNNVSERFLDFYSAVHRASPRNLMFLDTMPEFRPGRQAPDHHSFSSLLHPGSNIAMIDAARIHETILAHEIGHAWIQYVELCEDERVFKTVGDPPRSNQLSYVQSFVLDLKVNEVIRRKGFDMAIIDEDQLQSIRNLGNWLSTGRKPETKREEVFMALVLAAQMIEDDLESRPILARVEDSIAAIRQSAEPIFELATGFADAVRRYGYAEKTGIVASVDRCIELAFTHTGDPIDIDAELAIPEGEEITLDKNPEWLAGLTVKQKCEIGRKMALENVPMKHDWVICEALGGLSVTCRLQDGRVLGPWHFAFSYPMTPEERRMREINFNRMAGLGLPYVPAPAGEALIHAEQNKRRYEALMQDAQVPNSGSGMQTQHGPKTVQEINEMNRQNRGRLMNPAYPVSSPFPGLPNLHGRPYMAGLGRFLTHARLDMLLAGEQPCGYALNNPVTYVDPLGLDPVKAYFNSFIHRDEDIQRGVRISGFPGVWLPSVWNPAGMRYFTGDHRRHFEGGTARVRSWALFDSCAIGNMKDSDVTFVANSDPSHGLFGSPLREITKTAKPTANHYVIGNNCTSSGYGASVIVVDYQASNPLVPGAPPIVAHFQIVASRSESGYVSVVLHGAHTSYPWHEATLQVGSAQQHAYQYSAKVGNVPGGLLTMTSFVSDMVGGEAKPCPCNCP
ncbi:MAG: hypothetical protein JST40_06430 [Armatimonadetes bacterium]|nr:hypothetical protein [Armatimonadota bacterium]